MARNAQVVLAALRELGIAAEFSGRNDIVVGGRKISGSAKSILGNRTLFHGTLLFDTDLSVLSSALTPDESKIKAKGIKSVRSRVANLREFLPEMDVEQFLEKLQSKLQKVSGAMRSGIPTELQNRASALADTNLTLQRYLLFYWE